MAYDFKFPDVGEGITEGELVKWLVKEGDNVKENQSIVQIETDKSVVDLPSPKTGKIIKLGFKNGDTVKVGAVLCAIDDGSESSLKEDKTAETPKEETKQKKKEQPPVKENKDKEKPQKKGFAVVGVLEEAPETPDVEYKSHVSVKKGEVQSNKVLASPEVRELARENNISLIKIKGSGTDGRILKKDLPLNPEIPQQTVPVTKEKTPLGKIERVPLRGIRKAISENLTISNTIPQVTAMEDVNITKLWNLKEKEKKNVKGTHLTLLPFIVKASIAVLKENPYFNSYLDKDNNEIIVKKFYNIGIAVETPVGLVVPPVKNADNMTIEELSKAINELASKARERKLSPEEMKGSTFTLTNYGSIGGTYATPLINPGESAVLGIGKIFENLDVNRPSKKIKVLPLSLTFDHRIIDGAEASRFLETLKTYLEDPGHLFIEI
jgi:pyruvate dehydrogenase E2 component (dihydrolipoamide acetyltransferase)